MSHAFALLLFICFTLALAYPQPSDSPSSREIEMTDMSAPSSQIGAPLSIAWLCSGNKAKQTDTIGLAPNVLLAMECMKRKYPDAAVSVLEIVASSTYPIDDIKKAASLHMDVKIDDKVLRIYGKNHAWGQWVSYAQPQLPSASRDISRSWNASEAFDPALRQNPPSIEQALFTMQKKNYGKHIVEAVLKLNPKQPAFLENELVWLLGVFPKDRYLPRAAKYLAYGTESGRLAPTVGQDLVNL